MLVVVLPLCKQASPPFHTRPSHQLTEGEENERPPILPPDLAASASPGAERATAATVAATANFLATSVVKASHGLLLLLSPSSPVAAMRRGKDVDTDLCWARVSPAVVPVPTKHAEGAGTKPEDGTHASRPSRAADLMLSRFVCGRICRCVGSSSAPRTREYTQTGEQCTREG